MITLTKDDEHRRDTLPLYQIDIGLMDGPQGALQIHTDTQTVGEGHKTFREVLGITREQEKEILRKVVENAVYLFLQKAVNASDTVSEIQIEEISKEDE